MQSSNSNPAAAAAGEGVRRHNSGLSSAADNSSVGSRDVRKRKEKDRMSERRLKLDAHTTAEIDIGHIVDSNNDDAYAYAAADGSETTTADDDAFVSTSSDNVFSAVLTDSKNQLILPGKFKEMMNNMRNNTASLDRSSSDQSTGSLLYCKTPTTGGGPAMHGARGGIGLNSMSSSGGSGGGGGSGALSSMSGGGSGNLSLGKSSSLIFPTGVDSVSADDRGRVDSESAKLKRSKVNLRLDQCEAVRFPFKKKLLLNNLGLCHSDIPIKDLCGTALGNSLHTLSLAGNRLGSVPVKLVVSLPVLKTLDLSQCELHQLPEQFNLPKLTRLNLSHNRFTDFPEEVRITVLCGCVKV